MDFYKNMCDGELLAFYRASKRSVDSIKNMKAEIAKMEEEMRVRELDINNNHKTFKELRFYVSKLCTLDKGLR